jgi:hypothetical protein
LREKTPAGELPTVPQSAYLSLLGSAIFPSSIVSPQATNQRKQELDFMIPLHAFSHEDLGDCDDNLNRQGPEEGAEDPEERKETEQLPLTKDLMLSSSIGACRLARE